LSSLFIGILLLSDYFVTLKMAISSKSDKKNRINGYFKQKVAVEK
jgi:hypothetical protein